ncbi:lasso RiPP family leader peptide-containing protein [Patulibacter sp. SYSU D01012]|nr:lasso RiPP family leader peptide-containing protein [Patulibacter sp. SYSU D01012]
MSATPHAPADEQRESDYEAPAIVALGDVNTDTLQTG